MITAGPRNHRTHGGPPFGRILALPVPFETEAPANGDSRSVSYDLAAG